MSRGKCQGNARRLERALEGGQQRLYRSCYIMSQDAKQKPILCKIDQQMTLIVLNFHKFRTAGLVVGEGMSLMPRHLGWSIDFSNYPTAICF